jgi:hypothetical protein
MRAALQSGLHRADLAAARWTGGRVCDLQVEWTRLGARAGDRSEQVRVARLVARLSSRHRGVFESALAELELATVLLRAGVQISFLPESQSRTADLEGRVEQQRFYAEVTAVMRPEDAHRPGVRHAPSMLDEADDDEDALGGLSRRLLARVAQKSRQLVGYRDPVVLALTLAPRDRLQWPPRPRDADPLDLQRLAGLLTLALRGVPQLSAVFMNLWDVDPLPSRAAIRLANVLIAERSPQQGVGPRVRLLAFNPAASSPCRPPVADVLRGML